MSGHTDCPEFTPGEDLPQTPFSRVAGTKADGAVYTGAENAVSVVISGYGRRSRSKTAPPGSAFPGGAVFFRIYDSIVPPFRSLCCSRTVFAVPTLSENSNMDMAYQPS